MSALSELQRLGQEFDAPRPYPLTARQSDLLAFIVGYQEKHGTAPTLGEMCAHFEWGPRSTALIHLRQLEERGHIRRLPNRWRAIDVLHRPTRACLNRADDIEINGERFQQYTVGRAV